MVRDLKSRLAQFDRPGAPRPSADAAPRKREGDPLAGLIGAGAQWIGAAPTGYLLRASQPARGARFARTPLTDTVFDRMGGDAPQGQRWVVIDTETTGLESGTGTLVFLVGLLVWEPRRMERLQYFLPEPAGERRMLEDVQVELERADVLISYNGRGFDLTRLRSRMRMHRMDTGVLERPHLDLLYPARRLARGWLDDARLPTLERRWLGLDRDDDLPGSFAPEVYRDLQLDAQDSGLVDVLEHNARDIDRLPALAHWLARRFDAEGLEDLPASSVLALARALGERQSPREAHRCLEHVLRHGQGGERVEAWRLQARLLRRDGEHARAAEVLELAVLEMPEHVPLKVELAKVYEHRLANPGRARELIEEALQSQRRQRALGRYERGEPDTGIGELGHRLRRLTRKSRR